MYRLVIPYLYSVQTRHSKNKIAPARFNQPCIAFQQPSYSYIIPSSGVTVSHTDQVHTSARNRKAAY